MAQHLGRVHAERVGHPLHADERWVALPALERADEVAVHADLMRQILLAEPLGQAQAADVGPEDDGEARPSHAGTVRSCCGNIYTLSMCVCAGDARMWPGLAVGGSGVVRLIVLVLVSAVILATVGCAPSKPPPTPAQATPASSTPRSSVATPEARSAATVVRVVDGDTVDVTIDGRQERLRLIGIDTPETVDPRGPVQCFGREASDRAKQLLTAGSAVRLEADPSQDERDNFGRLLRYVWLADGRLFNLEMIGEGFAHEYTFRTPHKYQAQFRAAQAEARQQERGLWSPQTCGGNTEQPADRAAAPAIPAATAISATVTPRPAAPLAPAPAATTAPVAKTGNCHPSYPDVCIPPAPPDLNCGSIPHRGFRVLPPDPHRFDGDRDGIGYES